MRVSVKLKGEEEGSGGGERVYAVHADEVVCVDKR